MKTVKRVLIIVAAALVLVSALCVTACAKSYTNGKDFQNTTWVCIDDGETVTMDLHKDGTWELVRTDDTGDVLFTNGGEWFYTDGTITLTSDYMDDVAILKVATGGTLGLIYEDTMIFTLK